MLGCYTISQQITYFDPRVAQPTSPGHDASKYVCDVAFEFRLMIVPGSRLGI